MDVSPCMTNCSVHEVGNAPNLETCDRIWTATNFMNEDVLEFMVVGVDRVGNTAPIISHTWTVGKFLWRTDTYHAVFHFKGRERSGTSLLQECSLSLKILDNDIAL